MKVEAVVFILVVALITLPLSTAFTHGFMPRLSTPSSFSSLSMRRAKQNSHSSSQNGLKKGNKVSHKNSYAPVGYCRGDIETCKQMFDSNAVSGQLSYEQLVESKYLRFWPGKMSQAESVWNEIIGSCESCCTFQEMIEIHQVLDQISFNVESEMENERIMWDIEDLNYENMINYFHDAIQDTNNNLLSFQKFLDWEFIKAELWFHDSKGLTKKKLEEMWCNYVGSVNKGIDFDSFGDLYNEVCDYRYEV